VGLRTGTPAQRLALAAGRRLDNASPYVDALLPGSGVRLHAVLAPIAADGTCLVWEKRWDQVLDWTGAPFAKWFVGGKLNVA
jgi:Flp pilus assembly CpaF family ATPase